MKIVDFDFIDFISIHLQAGCIHFASNTTDLRILVLLFNPDKKSLLGFIPNNQSGFLERLKKVIMSQKKTNGARHEQVRFCFLIE